MKSRRCGWGNAGYHLGRAVDPLLNLLSRLFIGIKNHSPDELTLFIDGQPIGLDVDLARLLAESLQTRFIASPKATIDPKHYSFTLNLVHIETQIDTDSFRLSIPIQTCGLLVVHRMQKPLPCVRWLNRRTPAGQRRT